MKKIPVKLGDICMNTLMQEYEIHNESTQIFGIFFFGHHLILIYLFTVLNFLSTQGRIGNNFNR